MEPISAQKIAWRSQIVKELEGTLHHPCLVVTQFSKLTMKELESLRRELRPLEGRYLVAKNSLSRLALKELKLDSVTDWVGGQIGFVVGKKDPVALSKVLVKFAKDHEGLKLKGAFLEGQLMGEGEILSLAALPSREILLGKALFMIQSPISRLETVLIGTLRKFMIALQQLSQKKTEQKSE